jgi:hypothetical protein
MYFNSKAFTFKYFRNIQLPQARVTLWMLVPFIIYSIGIILYILVNTILESPYAMIVEICVSYQKQPTTLQKWKILTNQIPNFFNFASLLVDIKLVKFLKKTILPVEKSIFEQKHDSSSTSASTENHFNLIPSTIDLKSRRPVNPLSKRDRIISQWFNVSPTEEAESVEKIPVRATILSSLLVFPYLFVYTLSYVLNLTDYHRAVMNRMALTVSNAIRLS